MELSTAQAARCQTLLAELGNKKVALQGTEAYTNSLSSYFSQQAQLHPDCIVIPTTAEDVACVVRFVSAANDLKLALRSGGHAPNAGAANIGSGGITLDLSQLNNIDVSHDKKTASIGPGAKWGEVYAKLDALGLSVAGGRASPVGVGGLATGGGISYFSPRFGWTCDTVANFQVVLADGSIVNANAKENPDLLVALRGGSSNFGIVTRFDFNTFEQGQLWGGSLYHTLDTIDSQLKAFADFNSAENYDEYASLITSFGFAAGRGSGVVNNVEYTKPVEKPAVFAPFLEIPAVMNTMRLSNMADISEEQGSFAPYGLRQLSLQITHGSTLEMLKAAYTHWSESLPAIENAANIVWSLSLEPLPPAIYKKAATANSLGLADRTKPLVVTLLTAAWTDKADDEKIEQAARKLFADLEASAKKLGEYDPFIYLNYAAAWDNPIASYGNKSVEELDKVRQRVDPKGFFKHRVPGGFKIPS